MTATALLVGGPVDGQWWELDRPRPYVLASAPHTPAFLAKEDEAPDELGPTMRMVRYERRYFVVFGRKLAVYIADGTPTERIEATLAAKLLVPEADQLEDDYAGEGT